MAACKCCTAFHCMCRTANCALECAVSILRECGQAFIEHDAVFERGVHTLAVKRHDRVGGVADQRDLVFIIPGRATNGHE